MQEMMQKIKEWRQAREKIGLATVVATWGSAPRGVGAKMAFTASGQIAGSVSGGCVEGAVLEQGAEILAQRQPQLLEFGVADETAWEVGLACGGTISVFVEPLDEGCLDFAHQALQQGQRVATAIVVAGPAEFQGRKVSLRSDGYQCGSLGTQVDLMCQPVLQDGLSNGRSRQLTLTSATEKLELFIDLMLPPATLVIVGGVHIAIPLATMAQMLGYETTIIDPRRAFGSRERFPQVTRLVNQWPREAFEHIPLTRETAVVMLTHDPKIDDPALHHVLKSAVFYIGALGSRRTQLKRHKRLQEAGFSVEEIGRIHGPVGLDIGARTPAEIALAIMAQIIQDRA